MRSAGRLMAGEVMRAHLASSRPRSATSCRPCARAGLLRVRVRVRVEVRVEVEVEVRVRVRVRAGA